MRAEATKSLVLGFARVDGRLKVDRAQIRALTKATAKARRAFGKAAKQAAPQGGICPPAGMPGQIVRAGPQTPAAAPGVSTRTKRNAPDIKAQDQITVPGLCQVPKWYRS